MLPFIYPRLAMFHLSNQAFMPPFAPDGVYADIAYRVLPDCSIEAMTPDGLVKFENMDQFMASINGAPTINNVMHSTIAPDVPEDSNEQKTIAPDVLQDTNEQKTNVPASARPLDYYSILLGTIKKTEQDSAQLRALVYERARFNFKRDILFGHSSMALTDVMRHVNDFELAIARIEANNIGDQFNSTYREQAEQLDTARSSSNNSGQLVPYVEPNQIQQFENFQHDRRLDEIVPRVRFANQLIGILILGIVFIGSVIVAGILWHAPTVAPQIIVENKLPKTAEVPAPIVPYPLPTSYGIYVLSDNKLTELESLPINIPDPRVIISTEITKPSTTTISDNKPAFIIFRRDLLNNAPQKVIVRVIAHMERQTKFVGGTAMVTKIEGAWRVRNISREFKISPIPGQREMVIARPDTSESLAAGRYALVLNRIGYDFTVKGPVESPEFCLEGFETANGLVYTQCRTP